MMLSKAINNIFPGLPINNGFALDYPSTANYQEKGGSLSYYSDRSSLETKQNIANDQQKAPSRSQRPTNSTNRPRPRRSKQRYRLLPVLLAGILFFGLTILLCGTLWGLIAYLFRTSVAGNDIIPLLIYFLAIFLSSFLVSLLINAKHKLPIVLLSITILLISCFFSGLGSISIKGLLIKTAITFITAFLPFLIVKKMSHKRRGKNTRKKLA
ncbi:MAG: hypothetical protein RR396_06680 [Clostridiales bacterium]